MRKIVIASHSQLAKGIRDSCNFIIGKQENIRVLTAYETEDFDIKQEIDKIMSQLLPEDELIVLVDILGGSVSNTFAEYLTDRQFYLISGVNLPMVLSIVTSVEQNTQQLILQVLNEAKTGIQLVNDLLDDFEEENQ